MTIIAVSEHEVAVVTVGEAGPPGPQNLFIQNLAPVTSMATYLWIQTGLGGSGIDMTFWAEDGLP